MSHCASYLSMIHLPRRTSPASSKSSALLPWKRRSRLFYPLPSIRECRLHAYVMVSSYSLSLSLLPARMPPSLVAILPGGKGVRLGWCPGGTSSIRATGFPRKKWRGKTLYRASFSPFVLMSNPFPASVDAVVCTHLWQSNSFCGKANPL